MRVLRRAALVAAVLLSVSLAPAHAVTAFGTTYRVTSNGCQAFVSATTPSGVTRGYYGCTTTSGWRFIQGSGSHWSTTSSPYGASEGVLAVAIDGDTTWAVTTQNAGTFLRYHSGNTFHPGIRLTTKRLFQGNAALIAVGGKYLVVWSQDNGTGGSNLWEAHSLGGNVAPRHFYGSSASMTRDVELQLAYQPTTQKAVLVWTHQITQSQESILMSTSTGAGWSATRTVASNAWYPSLALQVGTVAVGYSRFNGTCGCAGSVALGTTSGITSRHALTGEMRQGPTIALSNGVLGAVWTTRTSPFPARAATRSTSGTWSERTLGAPYPHSILDVESVSGRLRFFADYGYIGVRAQ